MQKENAHENIEKKVVGYARVSTLEQAEKGTSIDEQKRIIHEECLKRGWQLVQIYCDEGASGNLTDRQGLHNLQRDARMGLFQTIVFTKSDRLTRSMRDLTNLWHDWTKLGLEIISVEQPEINSRGIYGKMLRNLLGIFAEWERDAIIERTASGRMARWQNAEAIMGTLPYGYEFDRINRKIVLHPEKSIICQRIFRMYLHQKLNTREIAARLYKESIPTPQNRHCRWQYATISNILKNPAYAGKSKYNMFIFETKIGKKGQQFRKRSKEKKEESQWITISFPTIISPKSHLKILDRMKLGSELFHRSRKSESYKNLFLLENIQLFCGECGQKMKMHIVSKKRDKPDDREKYSAPSESMIRNLNLETKRYDQVYEFDFGIRRIKSERLIKPELILLSTEMLNHINGMTFQQKKRIVESILAPENGGKCIIKWAKSSDHSHCREDISSKEASKYFRGAFRTEAQLIQITFLMT